MEIMVGIGVPMGTVCQEVRLLLYDELTRLIRVFIPTIESLENTPWPHDLVTRLAVLRLKNAKSDHNPTRRLASTCT